MSWYSSRICRTCPRCHWDLVNQTPSVLPTKAPHSIKPSVATATRRANGRRKPFLPHAEEREVSFGQFIRRKPRLRLPTQSWVPAWSGKERACLLSKPEMISFHHFETPTPDHAWCSSLGLLGLVKQPRFRNSFWVSKMRRFAVRSRAYPYLRGIGKVIHNPERF